MAALPQPIDYRNDDSLPVPVSTIHKYRYKNKTFNICMITLPQNSTIYRGSQEFADVGIRPTPKYFGSYDVGYAYAEKGRAEGTRGYVTNFNMRNGGSFLCIYSNVLSDQQNILFLLHEMRTNDSENPIIREKASIAFHSLIVVMGMGTDRDRYRHSVGSLSELLTARSAVVRQAYNNDADITDDVGSLGTYLTNLGPNDWLPSRTSIRRIDQMLSKFLKDLFGTTFMGTIYLDGEEKNQSAFDNGTKRSCVYFSEGSCVPSEIAFFDSLKDLRYTATVYDTNPPAATAAAAAPVAAAVAPPQYTPFQYHGTAAPRRPTTPPTRSIYEWDGCDTINECRRDLEDLDDKMDRYERDRETNHINYKDLKDIASRVLREYDHYFDQLNRNDRRYNKIDIYSNYIRRNYCNDRYYRDFLRCR
jgi:hypothetical protein